MVSIAQLHTILKKSNKYEKIAIAIGSIQQLCGPTFTQFSPSPTLETKMDIFHIAFFSTDPFPPFFEQQVIEYPQAIIILYLYYLQNSHFKGQKKSHKTSVELG